MSDGELQALTKVDELRAHAEGAMRARNESVQHALAAGKILLQWKKWLPHGQFTDFVDTHCPVSRQMANRWMKAAKCKPSLHLDSPQTIKQLLVEPKNPIPSTEVTENSDTPEGVNDDFDADEDDEEEVEEETTEDRMKDWNSSVESFCRHMMKEFKDKCPKDVWTLDNGRYGTAEQQMKNAMSTLRVSKCVICPNCDGETCDICNELGYLPNNLAVQIRK